MSVISRVSLTESISNATASEFTIKLTPYDQREYRKLTAVRAETMRRVASRLKPLFHLSSALDAGCGVGFFSQSLAECGLRVCGVDAREEDIAEARTRFPQTPFETADVQDRSILHLGRFDFVLCCGLLHRLENPFATLRNLRGLTEKCLLLESMCIPAHNPSMLLREDQSEDQHYEPCGDGSGSARLVCCPSESGLVKMLYRAGFAVVYRVLPPPDHGDFLDTSVQSRRRTVLLASSAPIDIAGFRLYPEPRESLDPWSKPSVSSVSVPHRLARFIGSPLRRQYITLALRARRVFPDMPIPLRLPFGAWWLAEKGALDHELMYGGFEDTEVGFVQRLLRPGMTVLDIGAHHGLYSLLAAKHVGKRGRVIAFEPSPRERRRLLKHVRVNRRRNVEVQSCALGNANGDADFFLVDGSRDWGNSLRPPAVPEPTRILRVPVRKLDDFLAAHGIGCVDFIKLDAEGGELGVLEGASRLLQTSPRPALLIEVEDIRTRQWGYAAREIVQLLARWNYRWFALSETNGLLPISADQESYDANFIALPEERTEEFHRLLAEPQKGDARWTR